MKNFGKMNASVALGSRTAAVALLAGAPGAIAQTSSGDTSVSGQAAPGGGSFPGSFLVPGTNTSIKMGGFGKVVLIDDLSPPPGGNAAPSVTVVQAIPLDGSAAHNLHGGFYAHARQSNLNADVRTPTAWGELDTFIAIDGFGAGDGSTQNNANTFNARLVLAYGSLGPLLGGQALSLFFDGDALPETVDPTPTIGTMNGLTNRKPQVRYTYAGAGGFSLAFSVENPEFEGISNGGGTTTVALGGVDRIPDFVLKGRLDQAWGHVSLAGVGRSYHVNTGTAATQPPHKEGWGLYASGHLNTIGKDTLKAGFMFGHGMGNFMSDLGTTGGLQYNLANGQRTLPTQYGANVSYTHWWTSALRSSLDFGYTHNNISFGAITSNAVQNGIDKRHMNVIGNLVWSPVPQVDLGIEYQWARKTTWASTATVSDHGSENRIEAETVFKF
jgi:hypothetical protein